MKILLEKKCPEPVSYITRQYRRMSKKQQFETMFIQEHYEEK